MSFAELFDSGFKNRNKGHFASIVRVAMENGHLSEEERLFLDKVAITLEISEEEYAEILANPTKYPVNPPYLHINRLERLYDLSRMVYADHILGPRQKEILIRFASALGFTPGNVSYIVDKSLSLMVLNVDLDTYLFEMQNMNR